MYELPTQVKDQHKKTKRHMKKLFGLADKKHVQVLQSTPGFSSAST